MEVRYKTGNTYRKIIGARIIQDTDSSIEPLERNSVLWTS